MRKQPTYVPTLLSIGLFFNLCACTNIEPLRPEPYEQGVLVLAEDPAQPGNATVSFLGSTGVSDDIFRTVNQRNLGQKLQSYTEIDGKGYLIVSNSDKVEIVENSTFRSIAIIDKGIEQGRYMVAAPRQAGLALKAYVSYWGGKTLTPGVAIVSLADRKVIGRITAGAGPEQLVVVGNYLFVANSGGEGVDNTVTVINTTTDQAVATIAVGDVPTSVVYDAATDLLYVLCSGRPTAGSSTGTTRAELVRIDPTTQRVVSRLLIGGGNITANPTNLVLYEAGKTLYFSARGTVYSLPVGATSISLDKPLITRSLNGFGVDPATGTIYGADRDSNGRGVVRRYRPDGVPIDFITVGSIPTGFYFK